ncbi:hypothetical protein WA026_000258 [Henosepilachna vigintioctopunctata]|uniref:Dynein regulatory complex protein 10 n=1 Tax=Henosepilachna vigintioctopunctata TaxID=420089 RepID=A0AAW1UX15_9CUCU
MESGRTTEKLEKVESLLPKITGKDYKHPVKFELEIQRQRILYILHTAIKHMELMARLPVMLKDDCKILKKFLTSPEVDFVNFACSKFIPGRQIEPGPNTLKFSKVLDNIRLIKMRQDQDHIAKSLLGSLAPNRSVDYYIAQVIQIITSNLELTKFIESITEEIEEPVRNMIECTIHLKRLIHERLMISSKEQIEMDKRLRVAFKSNVIISKDIRRLQDQMNKQIKDLGSDLGKKNITLSSYEEKLEELKEEFKTVMNKMVQKSEKQMMNDSCNSEVRQATLEHDAHAAETQYANLLEEDLAAEAQLRLKRNKVEAQLSSWLTKYDNDVGEKQAEFEKLEKEYEEMNNNYDDLMDKFTEQSVEYEILMAEKEEEERQIYEEMAYEFLKNRSARIIQKEWRNHRQRKLDRRRQEEVL